MHALQSFTAFVGNKKMSASWVPWYFLRPLMGGALALLSYLVVRAGLVQADGESLNPYGIAAIGGLAGLFSKRAINKLAEVCDTLFQLKSDVKEAGALDPENNRNPD